MNHCQPAASDDGQGFTQDFNDADSAVGSSSASHATTSLAESVMNYEYENGRRYHAFRKGEYLLPNDESEQNRLDLQHHVFRLTLGGKLFRAPIVKNPQRVLDMGTGTGIWAIDFADEFPSAEIIGTDLSPIQPSWVPPNCKFLVDDLESDWVWSPSEAFDFIHGKGLGGSIRDWPRLYRQIYRHLKPGGWIEMQEYEGLVASDDDPELLKAPYLNYWQHLVNKALVQIGKKFNVAGEQKQHMIDAGFVDVREDIYKVSQLKSATLEVFAIIRETIL
jgi:SAM-dependent methyltransferase